MSDNLAMQQATTMWRSLAQNDKGLFSGRFSEAEPDFLELTRTTRRKCRRRDDQTMTFQAEPDREPQRLIQDTLQEYRTTGRMAEIIYRDGAWQVCIAHDVIRDVFSRAGSDFVMLGRGAMLELDHIMTIDGWSPRVGMS